MKNSQPPRIALALLALAPPEYRRYLIGDLYEEFARRGGSSPWYWRQVGASLPGLLELRWRRSLWIQPATAFAVAAAWVVVGWHALWSFVLSQVPCKADPARWFW